MFITAYQNLHNITLSIVLCVLIELCFFSYPRACALDCEYHSTVDAIDTLPGEAYTIEEQCEMNYGEGYVLYVSIVYCRNILELFNVFFKLFSIAMQHILSSQMNVQRGSLQFYTLHHNSEHLTHSLVICELYCIFKLYILVLAILRSLMTVVSFPFTLPLQNV